MKAYALVLAAVLSAAAVFAQEAKAPGKTTENFDAAAVGALPKGWTVDATNPKGDLATWKVAPDANAASKPNVLAITAIPDGAKGVFNLCWTNAVAFRDGTIGAKVRADSGKIDQGGGLIWRVKDAKNYYLCRYNPLETNFCLYYVKDGVRKKLAEAKDLVVKTGEWFAISVTQKGDRIACSLNGKKLLDATDATFADAGGVGFWSKADAASSFDDLEVSAE